MIDKFYIDIMEFLISLRKQRHKTQKDIAGFLGVTQQTYNRYETGSSNISLHNFYIVCKMLGVVGVDFTNNQFIIKEVDEKNE